MPFLIGIDEAGYGPNLGPLVQTAAIFEAADASANLWKLLATHVRRAADDDDHRLVIDDSKLVYSGPNGFERLERTVGAIAAGDRPLGQWLGEICSGASCEDLAREAWYRLDERLAAQTPVGLRTGGIAFHTFHAVVTPAARFNAGIDHWDSKGRVAADGVIELMRVAAAALPASEPLHFAVDKQGGRNFYAPLIQTAFPDGWVVPMMETADRSEYRIDHLGREVRLTFVPRADSESLPVALASMLAKYLREVCMRQFNQYWQKRVPGLEPTAGYPGDAARFFSLIQRAMRQQGLSDDQVWRKR